MRLLPLLFLAATPFAASAETISQEIARTGLAATETRLAALTERKPEDQLALGSVQFLRAIEGSFQTRWKAGLTDRTGMLPLLRPPPRACSLCRPCRGPTTRTRLRLIPPPSRKSSATPRRN